MLPPRARSPLPLLGVLLSFGPPGAAAQAPAAEDLRLRPGDMVRLEIADEPELSGEFVIGADGAVLLPRIELVVVAGRPFSEVAEEATRAYERELAEQAVRVTPLMRIAVLGEVREPGLFPVDPTFGLGDILAAAGGFTREADRRRVLLWREGRETAVSAEVLPTGELYRPRSGDRIVVPGQGWLRENLTVVFGAAASVAAAAVTALILQ